MIFSSIDDLQLVFALILLTSFGITYFLLPKLIKLAPAVGLLDYPTSTRKIHLYPKPLVGGIGMIIGFILTSMMFIPTNNLKGLYIGIVILGIVGFLDDYKELNHKIKFVAQFIAAFFLTITNKTVLMSFGDIFGQGAVLLQGFSIPVTIFCAVGIINAMNMIDGLDGLSGGISLAAFSTFGLLAFYDNNIQLLLISCAFVGVLVAFLLFNIHPSKLFMGDAGSMTLGFSLTFVAISLTQREGTMISPAAALLVLAVPIVDTLVIMINRTLRGKNPFHADKYHLHHILLRVGFDKKTAVKIIVTLTGYFCAAAYMGSVLKVEERYLVMIFVSYFAGCVMLSLNLKALHRLLRRKSFIATLYTDVTLLPILSRIK